jgi:hypothetical protein
MSKETKSQVIRVDFGKQSVTSREEFISTSSGYRGAVELREIQTPEMATRLELIEQAAHVAAHLDLAKRFSKDELEVQDLKVTLDDCLHVFNPGLSEEELNGIEQRAKQMIEDLEETIGNLEEMK